MEKTAARTSALKIGRNAFLLSAVIILCLIIVSGILVLVLPAGEYQRVVVDGRTLVVDGSFSYIDKPNYPIWRWFTAPIELLFSEGNITVITIILFIISVGGAIAILEGAGVMEELIQRLVRRFSAKKYLLAALIILFFMTSSAFIGVYEGMVPMIIFIVPLAISLGWDSLTGLGLSLLPLAFGFAAAVTNPFTIAVAQKIADLPLFSGSVFRIIFFAAVYALVTGFVLRYAKKIEKKPELSLSFASDEALRAQLRSTPKAQAPSSARDRRGISRALVWFAACVGIAMLTVLLTARLPGLSDLAFPVMGLLFLVGGFGGGRFTGLSVKALLAAFGKGAMNLLPGVILILLAYSVKHIIVSGRIMDTLLHSIAELIRGAPPLRAAFLVYAATLVMNFFIGSASAKAFLMMPLLTPLADLVGITRQTAVLAFDFGDGFSNMFFPTNALLLIALSFTVVAYPKWMAWTWKLQIAILGLTSAFLAIAVGVGFGPF